MIILESSGDIGIIFMQSGLVFRRVVHSGNTALCKGSIAERKFPFCQKQNLCSFRKIDSGIQASRTASGNDNIILILCHENASP